MNAEKSTAPRPYRMTRRAGSAAQTAARILDAAHALFSTQVFDQVRLADIARDAKVTEQTVIRRFGSKTALFSALAERETQRIAAERRPPDGDRASLQQAIQTLVAHYEKDGRAMLNFLQQEDRSAPLKSQVQQARRLHEDWVCRYCSDILGPQKRSPAGKLAVVLAATDLYVWKLLRLDRGMTPDDVVTTMLALLRGASNFPEEQA